MRTIQKQISLEPMTSRLPSVWPAYKNNELYCFDEESLKSDKRQWQYTSNWGMVPVNIVLNHNPSEGLPYSAYSIVSSCTENCNCSGHCYDGGYTTISGTPTHCLNESGQCICCEVDDYLNVVSRQIPYYYDEFVSFTLSFESLSKRYYFFNEYYNLLKQYSHCDRVYTSAEDYYDYESGTKYANQMIYGTDKQTYLDLDNEFAEKGGRVEVLVFDKDTSEYLPKTPKDAHDEKKTPTDRMAMVDVYDVGFFKWICDNVVPSFIIPMRYKDYWKRDRLFYPDVIKWMAWLKERIIKGYESAFKKGENGELDSWNCKSSAITDCCDCEEYFNRGGERIYSAMSEWFNNVQDRIVENSSIISGSTDCFVPTVILPTELQVSIDDLGEFSIFSKEYELGKDYRTAHYGDNENTLSGTVSSIDGHSVILIDGSGYTFNPYYMEKYVSSCNTCGYEGVFYGRCPKCGSRDIQISGWTDYTDYYTNPNHEYEWDDGVKYNYKNDFYVSAVTYFAYDDENVKYTSLASSYKSAEDDFKSQMSKKYLLTTRENGWILIDGDLYPINEIEYATYDKANKYLRNKKYMIFREKGTNTPYTFINGEKIYAEFYEPKNKFYFPFFKKPNSNSTEMNCSGRTFNFNDYISFDRNKLNDEKIYYIYYDDNAYSLSSSADTDITINEAFFFRISAYTTDNLSNIIYVTYKDDEKIISGETMDVVPNNVAVVSSSTEYFDGKPFINVIYPFEVNLYSVNEINGRTISKLSDLRLYNVLTDDVGNDIDGIYEINSDTIYNHQPPEGTVLELLYQVGNTANISRFSLTEEDLDDIVDDKNYFVGDIITRMTFYYKETDETIPKETIVDVVLESGDTYAITMNGEKVSGYTSLSAISASTMAKEELEKDEEVMYSFYDDIFCDITYYIGATLRRKIGENYNLCYEPNRDNHGVEYKETVQFVKENREYYLKKPKSLDSVVPSRINDVCNHSVSYPIYVYKLTQIMEHVDDSQYDSSYSVPMADFRFNINIFSGNTDTFNNQEDMEEHNGMQVLPVFREEYRFGISSMENVDSDIYIDRGINAAFEKHLKLGEVTSLEALEQYGLNFFKIMDS